MWLVWSKPPGVGKSLHVSDCNRFAAFRIRITLTLQPDKNYVMSIGTLKSFFSSSDGFG